MKDHIANSPKPNVGPPEKATELNQQKPSRRAETVLTRYVPNPLYATRSNPEFHPQRAITRAGLAAAQQKP